MNKLLLTLLTACVIAVATGSNAQDCRVIKDSISSGQGMGNYTVYIRDWQNNILETQRINASDNNFSYRDTVYYNGDGTIDRKYTTWLVSGNFSHELQYIYDLSGRIIRAEETGDNGNGVWTKAFDFSYNVSGELTSIVLDPTSLTGTPEGFMGSFNNMSYTGGNVTYMELVNDFGGGPETIELNGIFDTQNSIGEQILIHEAPEYVLYKSVNNLTNLQLANNETIGNAGDDLVNRSYSYNVDNNVTQMIDDVSIINQNATTIGYLWDCSLGIDDEKSESINVYPNPAQDVIHIEGTFNELKLTDLNGKVLIDGYTKKDVMISDFNPGIYLIYIDGLEPIKVLKK
ncbi:MAG: T9SS type A sorting domain-containing protein [Crocinitomicaceae bacterium]